MQTMTASKTNTVSNTNPVAAPRDGSAAETAPSRTADTLLTGDIRRELIALTLPLLLSNILQQLYNTGDSLIIARFLGSGAFASTGISGTLMNLFLFVLNGFCVGVSVLFAQAYGMGNARMFRQDFFHALLTGTALTLLFSALTIGLLDPLLRLIRTPEALMDYCRIYMTVILAGLPASFFYNFFASVLRSVGNTRWALYILLLSVTANILLDLLFVAVWGMGIAGAAYATVLAQLLSALCCFFFLKKRYPGLICRQEDLRIRFPALAKVLRFGMVSALHQSSLYIGKILVQGAVNTLGAFGIAAYTATMRVEGFVNSFGDSGSQAMSIFISQNYGAGNRERTRDGFFQGALLLTSFGLFASAVMFFASRACLRLFLEPSDGLALGHGVSYLKIVALFYVLCFLGNAFVGWFRGTGRVAVPFLGTTLHLTLRVVLSWALVGRLGLPAVALATGAGWMLVIAFFAAVTALLRRSAPPGEGPGRKQGHRPASRIPFSRTVEKRRHLARQVRQDAGELSVRCVFLRARARPEKEYARPAGDPAFCRGLLREGGQIINTASTGTRRNKETHRSDRRIRYCLP